MIKYREIFRLNYQGLSNRSIASGCGCSQNTVSEMRKKAEELQVSWPIPSQGVWSFNRACTIKISRKFKEDSGNRFLFFTAYFGEIYGNWSSFQMN